MHHSKLDDGAPGCSKLRTFQSLPAKQHQVPKRFRQAIKALLPSPTCPCPHCHALRSSLHCKPSSICCKATAHEYQTTAKKNRKPPHCHPATPVAQLRSQESSSAAPEAALALAATAITVSASTAAAAACFLACFSSFLASEGQHSTAQHRTAQHSTAQPQERRQHRVHSGQLNIPGPLWLHQSLQLTHQCWWSASSPPSAGSNFKWHITCTAAQG